MSEQRFVYADNAATTPVSAAVIEAMMPALTTAWGNPSSQHEKGYEAKALLDDARRRIAACLACSEKEVFFTSSGSEADNWAIRGAAAKNPKRRHIITTKIEHHAVLHACRRLEKEGDRVTYLDVDENGVLSPETLRAAIDEDTSLVAVMMANNEIGTLEPIAELAKIAHEFGALMFTDAVQAFGAVPVIPSELGVDLLSVSGHKLNAPKGIGVLYTRRGVSIANLIEGGGQERRRRGGTENVPYALGMARAMEIALERLPDMQRISVLRDRLIDGLLAAVPAAKLNGPRENRLPGNCNIGFECVEGESILMFLDMEGICASTGSACSSDSLEPSHVLLAIGVPHEKAHGSVRLSLSHDNTEEDVDYILEKLPPIVARLRAMSPIWQAPEQK